MDLATLIGLIAGFGLVAWSLMAGGDAMAYVDVPSILIVFGGGTASVLTSFPLGNILTAASVMKKTLLTKTRDPADLIKELVGYAEIARRDGILSLENLTKDIDDNFIVSGIQMAVDGTDPELIEQVMTSELDSIAERHEGGKAIFDAAAKYYPAFGMIGTLIGLIAMLKNMSDPSMIGAGMAVALITTLYGACAANMVFLPLADKLAKRSAEELMLKTIVIRGVMAIQAGDNPRVVEQRLTTFIPYRKRRAEEEPAGRKAA
jgi:chemotaxis protein MotA